MKENQSSDNSDEEIPRNFEDAYSSEDSEDEKVKLKKLNLPPIVRLENTSFSK